MSRAPWEITREMFLSEAETDALLRHVRQEAGSEDRTARLDQLIVETMLFSGMRNSEFCSLRLGDTHADQLPPRLEIGSRREHRQVYLPLETAGLLTQYMAEIRPQVLPAGLQVEDPAQPLIFHERRRPFERTGLYRRVVRILTAAGLGDRASVQLLRHTYGYLAYLRTGGNLLFVQRQLGHAHPMITSIYAQFVDESYPELADRIAQLPTPGSQRREAGEPVQTQVTRHTASAVEEFEREYD